MIKRDVKAAADYYKRRFDVDLDPVKVADTLGVEFGAAGQGIDL